MVRLKNKEDMRILQEELADQKEIDDIRHAKKLNEIRKLLEDIEIMITSLKKRNYRCINQSSFVINTSMTPNEQMTYCHRYKRDYAKGIVKTNKTKYNIYKYIITN